MTIGTVAAGTSAAGAARGGAISTGANRAGIPRTAAIPAALTPGGAQAVFRATLDALARPGTVKRLPSAADGPLAGHVPAALLPLLALADLSTPACVVDGAATADAAPVAGEARPHGTAGRTAWDEIVRVATNAPRAALGDARLVAALRPLTAAELASLRTGTAAAPEDGALACLAVAGIAVVEGLEGQAGQAEGRAGVYGATESNRTVRDGAAEGGSRAGERLWLRLSGPGVPGLRAVIVTGLPGGFAAARSGLVARFPAGADLLLIAPDGAMTGLPRTTEVHEGAV
jgi:alpha-D-ribose 1-methylphosphonate 5-triphosphate synthase subunit PhnH